MDENDSIISSVTCQGCGSEPDEELTVVDVNVEFQGTMPLLVILHRCPLCDHEWTDAREPFNQPEVRGRNPEVLLVLPLPLAHRHHRVLPDLTPPIRSI
jgi:hypothetical protein